MMKNDEKSPCRAQGMTTVSIFSGVYIWVAFLHSSCLIAIVYRLNIQASHKERKTNYCAKRDTVLTNSRRGEMGGKGGGEQSRRQQMKASAVSGEWKSGGSWVGDVFGLGVLGQGASLGHGASIFALYILMIKRTKLSFLPPLPSSTHPSSVYFECFITSNASSLHRNVDSFCKYCRYYLLDHWKLENKGHKWCKNASQIERNGALHFCRRPSHWSE